MEDLMQQFEGFCRSKPADEKYEYMNGKDCPTAQFAQSIGRGTEYYGSDLATAKKIINPDADYPFVECEIYAATKPHTYGALADRIKARVHDEPGGVFNPA